MSKKKNKVSLPVTLAAPEVEKEENHIELPAQLFTIGKGKEKAEEWKARRTKKLAEQESALHTNFETIAVDTELLNTQLSSILSLVKSGKYGKALKEPRDVIDLAISAYTDGGNPDLDDYIRDLIRIAKSYYEYDDKHRDFINDKTYDGILAKFKENGNVEPTGIVPTGKKSIKKTSIKYPTLHNNMDKSYAIRMTDPIPEGVKEKTKIEGFLNKVYAELSLDPGDKIELELSPKIDGVSINGTIEKNQLIDPQTRGDSNESVSVEGMNHLVVTNMENDDTFGIQYEAFVTEEDRVKASEYLGLKQPYVSCRHAAAGIVSRLSSGEDNELLEFISLYPIMAEDLDGTYLEIMDYIQNFGLVPKDMPERKVVKGSRDKLLNEIERYYQRIISIRPKLSFAVDGIVITITNDEQQDQLGRVERTNQYQIALKFDPAGGTSTVENIYLDSGNKGYHTIQVGLKDPVFIDGVRYDHVPVLSIGLFEDLGLRKDSVIEVRRVADVIPTIIMKDRGVGKLLKLPKNCPGCNKELKIKAKKLYCDNQECPDNAKGTMKEFFSKIGMDAYGAGFADMLFSKFGVISIGDLFMITDEDIKRSGINSKKLEQFPSALRTAISGNYDYKLIAAMAIPGIGPAKAKKLLSMYSLEELKKLDSMDMWKSEQFRNDILTLVGPETANITYEYLTSYSFQKSLCEMYPYIKLITKDFSEVQTVGHSGKELSDEFASYIRKLGFDITDGKSFDILIVPNHDVDTGKMNRAKKKGLPIYTEEEFKTVYKE